MNEQLVTLKTSLLAREKKFNIPVLNCYNENGELGDVEIYSLLDFNKFPVVKGSNTNLYSAPTQSLLQQWLRDNQRLHIEIKPWKSSEDVPIWFAQVFTLKRYNMTFQSFEYVSMPAMGKTYEEALELGLIDALNLIN